ncbi:MAG: hypothetical protein M1455_06440 [Actinobacteria bacterium]|nr:hypothetical protein [Actinomycetota bacterium]
MGVVFILARDLQWEINTGTEAVPSWVRIKGLDGSAWPNPDIDSVDTDDSDSGGIASSVPVRIKRKVTLKGNTLEDEATGARDPGQEACEAATTVGYTAIKQFRYTTSGGTVVVRKGWCRAGSTDGGKDDKLGWECEINFNE